MSILSETNSYTPYSIIRERMSHVCIVSYAMQVYYNNVVKNPTILIFFSVDVNFGVCSSAYRFKRKKKKKKKTTNPSNFLCLALRGVLIIAHMKLDTTGGICANANNI